MRDRSLIDDLLARGRAAWPGVEVDADRFAAYLDERASEGGDVAALHVEDLYLACACEAGDARAIAAFEARYIVDVPAFLAGVEHAAANVAEVEQLVRARLFVAEEGARPKIADYSGRGALGSWVRVVALRLASNRRRGDKRHQHADVGAAELLPTVDPELAIVKSRYGPAFDEAVRDAFAALTARERLLFRMHFLDGLTLDHLAVVFHVHRATVARWIASARETLLERTTSLLGERLSLAPSEVESLLAVVRSGLDLSLRSLLEQP